MRRKGTAPFRGEGGFSAFLSRVRYYATSRGMIRKGDLFKEYVFGDARAKGESMEDFVDDLNEKRERLEGAFGRDKGGFIPEELHGMLMLERARMSKSDRRQIRRHCPGRKYDPDHIERELTDLVYDYHDDEKGAHREKRRRRANAFAAGSAGARGSRDPPPHPSSGSSDTPSGGSPSESSSEDDGSQDEEEEESESNGRGPSASTAFVATEDAGSEASGTGSESEGGVARMPRRRAMPRI